MRLLLAALCVASISTMTACGGGSGGGALSVPPAVGKAGVAAVMFSIAIPARTSARSRKPSAQRHPSYVSSSTQSVVVTLDGTVVAPGYFNAVGPLINVTIPNVSTGAHTFVIDAHQGTNGTGPILSTASQSYTVLLNSSNSITLTLNGVVASVTLSASNTTPPVGTTATPITITAAALDAAGVPITGTYATPIALTTSDATDFPIAPASLTQDISTATVTHSGLCKAPATIGANGIGTVTPVIIGTNRQVLTSQADTLTAGTLRYNLTNILTPTTIEVIPSGYTVNVTSPLPAVPNGQTVCGAQRGVSALVSGGSSTSVFALTAGSTVGLNGFILTGALAATNGPGLSIPAGARANVTNVIFTASSATGGGDGGAVSVAGTLTCTTCTFNSNNAAGLHGGGAIYVAPGGVATIDGGLFNGNTGGNEGGAITVDQTGMLTVINGSGTTTFSSNTAAQGGALYVIGGVSGMTTVTGAAFTSNTATTNGGAIASVSNPGTASYSCALCTFSSNSALSGGAIYMPNSLNGGVVTIDRSVFTGNSATGSPANGGAIADADYSVTVTNSAFINNQTTGGTTDCGGGFALLNHRGGATLTNTLFYGNSTLGNGGAMCSSVGSNADTIVLNYSTVASNTASVGGGSIYLNPNGCAQLSADIIQGGAPSNFATAVPNNCATFSSSGYSLINEDACGTCAGSFPLDVIGVTTFSPSAPAGVPVPYLAITNASAAYGIGVGCGASTDVRGNPRPHLSANCSAGEFEP